jgi:hypothetical protein
MIEGLLGLRFILASVGAMREMIEGSKVTGVGLIALCMSPAN